MRSLVAPLCAFGFLGAAAFPAAAADCPHNPDALGVARVLEVETAGGPLLGSLQYDSTLELGAKEVVLTFDDGPHKINTSTVLASLARECVKATFFVVGTLARKYPELLQQMADQGHTIGTHSWSHPRNLSRTALATAQRQIERGFEAISAAVEQPIAPFFRFPGLNDSKALRRYTAQRGYAVFSTDISSDDWLGIGARTIVRRTMARLKRRGNGMVLLHDTKRATAAAVPLLLQELKRNGFRIVHLVPRQVYSPDGHPLVAGVSALEDGPASKPRPVPGYTPVSVR